MTIRLNAAILAVAVSSAAANASIFTVTTTADAGEGSLRQAIHDANIDTAAPHTIRFSIGPAGGPQTISLFSPMETVTRTTAIDGTTQPGYAPGVPLITLDGGGSVGNGLRITANNCAVKGLIVRNFGADGLLLQTGSGAQVQGNQFVSNGGNGVAIVNSANNAIGSLNPGMANRMSLNAHNGVMVLGVSSTGNSILGNSIYGDGGLGINLQPAGEPDDTVTPNDINFPPDSDSGPNNLQNFPNITSIAYVGGNTIISGTLISTPTVTNPRQFRIELFRSPAANPKGYGEGQNLVTAITVSTDPAGVAPFVITFPGYFPYEWFAATATDLSTSDTSEFGAAVQANPGSFEFSALTWSQVELDTMKSIAINRVGGTYGAVTVDYASSVPLVHPAKPGSVCGVPDPADGKLPRYVPVAGTLSFADGESSKNFNIHICDDSIVEPDDELVNLALSNPTGGANVTFGKESATLFIIDNDVQISVDDVSAGMYCLAGSTAFLNFTVSLSSKVSRTVTVTCATEDGRPSDLTSAIFGIATAPANYFSVPPIVLTFPAGTTTRTVTVSAACGSVPKGKIYLFHLDLSSPVNGKILKGDGRGSLSYIVVTPVCCLGQPQARLAFDSVAGAIYRMEYSSDLGFNANWAPVPGAEMIQGNGQTIEVIDQSSFGRPQRFYRLAVLQ